MITTLHDLKCWPEHFQALWDEAKTAELRKDDRPYAVGDTLRLHEYEPMRGTYSGRVITTPITHIVRGGPWLAEGYVMLSLGGYPRSYADFSREEAAA